MTLPGWSAAWPAALPTHTEDEARRLLSDARASVEALQRAVGGSGRALHRRGILVTARAALHISESLPEALRLGPFQPGAAWPAVVRLSSAFPRSQSDEAPDQRGIAVRIEDAGRRLDLLATTGEAHHARDAAAMIASLRAAASAVEGGRLRALATLVRLIGLRDGLRMARTLSRAAQHGRSLAASTFYSRAPFQLGAYAVRYRLAAEGAQPPDLRASGHDALRDDLLLRLGESPVRWSLEMQGYLDQARTPMDDHRVRWDSPWLAVGRLELEAIPGIAGPEPEGPAFRIHPDWPDANGPVLLPLGDLNLLRGAAYAASQAARGAG
jgi:hypothetical protein